MRFFIDDQGVLGREWLNAWDDVREIPDETSELYIPDGVTQISADVFAGLGELKELVLPQSLRVIGAGAFSGCAALRSVRFRAGLAEIGDHAFRGCVSLRDVYIPASVARIGAGAFSGCLGIRAFRVGKESRSFAAVDGAVFTRELRELVACPAAKTVLQIPGSVQVIADEAFADCAWLTALRLPKRLRRIGREAFSRCVSLRELRLPDSVTEIGEKAFAGCRGLLRSVLSAGLTSLPERLFEDCDSLMEIGIPEGVTGLGRRAFANCRLLQRAALPQHLVTIAAEAFTGCAALADISLPGGLTEIGERAFHSCAALREIRIPRSVGAIGSRAFEGCSQLTAFRVEEGNPAFSAPEGLLCSADGTRLITAPGGLEAARVPEGVAVIEESAFARMDLREVTLPASLRRIGQHAFAGCAQLQAVSLAEGLDIIGWGAFENCGELSFLVIPATVQSIGPFAFHRCARLAEVRFMGGVRTIGNLAFTDCRQLRELTLPEGTERIESTAFSGCGSLTRVSLPDSLRFLGAKAFACCTSLRELRVPAGLMEPGPGAFAGCPSLADENGLVIVNHRLCGMYGRGGDVVRIPPEVAAISEDALQNVVCVFQCRWPAGQRELSLSRMHRFVMLNLTETSVFDGSCSELWLPCAEPRLELAWKRRPGTEGSRFATCVITPGPGQPQAELRFQFAPLEIIRCGDLDEQAFPRECTMGFMWLERRGDHRLSRWEDSYARFVRADPALQKDLLEDLDNLPVMLRLDMVDEGAADGILDRVLSRGSPAMLTAWLGWLRARGLLQADDLRRILRDVRDTEVSALCLEYLRELAPGGEDGAADEGL